MLYGHQPAQTLASRALKRVPKLCTVRPLQGNNRTPKAYRLSALNCAYDEL